MQTLHQSLLIRVPPSLPSLRYGVPLSCLQWPPPTELALDPPPPGHDARTGRRAQGPARRPASVCSCTHPSCRVKPPGPPLRQLRPWFVKLARTWAPHSSLIHPLCKPQRHCLPQALQTPAPASYTLTCPLTSPGTPCFIRLHTALAPMPVHRHTRFLFLTLCHVDPPALSSLHLTPTPRSTHFPDTLSHAHPRP